MSDSESIKSRHERYAKEKADYEFLEKLKFVELHYHIDGSITAAVALPTAKVQNFELPTTNKNILRSIIRVPPGCKDLVEFLHHFDLPLDLMQTKEGISESIYQCQEKFKKNGGIYLEMRFAPQFHLRKGLTQRQVIEAALEGLHRSDLKANLILCIMKIPNNKEANRETLELAKEFLVKDNGVVAIDIAGDEFHFKTQDYAEEFEFARKNGIPFTIHAGESDGYASVDTAVNFGAKRLGHGVRCVENENTMKTLREKNILLEVCPFSNFCTNSVDEESYPFKKILDAGIKMCLNTDDMAIIGNHLVDEFTYVISNYELTKMQILDLIYNAIDGAFTTDEVKAELRKQIDAI